MPASCMAMTKGDEAASPVLRLRRGSFDGTSKPMMRTDET